MEKQFLSDHPFRFSYKPNFEDCRWAMILAALALTLVALKDLVEKSWKMYRYTSRNNVARLSMSKEEF